MESNWADEKANLVCRNNHVPSQTKLSHEIAQVLLETHAQGLVEGMIHAAYLLREEDRGHRDFHSRYGDPPNRMDLVNHTASNFIKSQAASLAKDKETENV